MGPKKVREIEAGKLVRFEDYMREQARNVPAEEKTFLNKTVTARLIVLDRNDSNIPQGLPAHHCRLIDGDDNSDWIIFSIADIRAEKPTGLALDHGFEEAGEINGRSHQEIWREKMGHPELKLTKEEAEESSKELANLGLKGEGISPENLQRLTYSEVDSIIDMRRKAPERLAILQQEKKERHNTDDPLDKAHDDNMDAFERAVGGIALSEDMLELNINAEENIKFNLPYEIIRKFQSCKGMKVVSVKDGGSVRSFLDID